MPSTYGIWPQVQSKSANHFIVQKKLLKNLWHHCPSEVRYNFKSKFYTYLLGDCMLCYSKIRNQTICKSH